MSQGGPRHNLKQQELLLGKGTARGFELVHGYVPAAGRGEHLKRLSDADEAPADVHRLTRKLADMGRGLEGEKLNG